MHVALLTLYTVVQLSFLFGLLVTLWFLAQKVNLIPAGRTVSGAARPRPPT